MGHPGRITSRSTVITAESAPAATLAPEPTSAAAGQVRAVPSSKALQPNTPGVLNPSCGALAHTEDRVSPQLLQVTPPPALPLLQGSRLLIEKGAGEV